MKTKLILILLLFTQFSFSQKKNRAVGNYNFINSLKNFNEEQGDFLNINHQDTNYNFMVKYLKKYNKNKNVIIVAIRNSSTSSFSINDKKVTVYSKRFGEFSKNKIEKHYFSNKLPGIVFIKKLNKKQLKKYS